MDTDEKMMMRQDMLQENHLRRDFYTFRDFTEKEHGEALQAIKTLKNLYEMYGHEFDLKELENES